MRLSPLSFLSVFHNLLKEHIDIPLKRSEDSAVNSFKFLVKTIRTLDKLLVE